MNYYLIAQISFAVLTAVCLTTIYRGICLASAHFESTRQEKLKIGYWLIMGCWLAMVSVAAFSGFTSNFDSMPPGLPMFIFPPLVALIFVLKSKTTNELLQNIPPKYLVNFQMFRVPVEILLWLLLLVNVIPVQMTFEGRNFDILAGLTAPIASILWFTKGKQNRTMGIIWNVLCLLLLLNIVVVAILSMPLPFRVFMNEPANTEVGKFPVVLLPTFLVPMAYYFHALSIKQLLLAQR